mgnify:CR=1 FL=1
MRKKVLILNSLLVISSLLNAREGVDPTIFVDSAVVPHDKEYYKYNDNNIEIIYTRDNINFAKHAANIESSLHKDYEGVYDWKLDEPLYVGLISSNNQIANGFSTQWPNNRQINYVGGAAMVDYFSCDSWLDTLLYHETAHNYQVNMKVNPVSQYLHAIFGNGTVLIPIPMNVPNVAENSFMLEGNAVLNESWHGNGGRLYSGRFKAETVLQAKAGNITPSDAYNSKLAFPYGDIVYIQGGFYNLYIAQKYGLKKANSYFKNHSYSFWWPFYTDASMQESIGVNFTKSLNDFSKRYASLAKNFIQADGAKLASSQFFTSLSNSENEIFFTTNESGVGKPELVVFDKKKLKTKKIKESWMSGKVVKVGPDYYTQASAYTSPTKIHQGLFSNEGFVKKGTESKIVQAYLHDGREVYFDVASSFSKPQLYVDDKFYSQVSSSVIVDKEDNLYYFVQDKKTRTLYKNKTPLYSYKGFYGIVSDVDTHGVVYFVANSELGSTLYMFDHGEASRVSDADNVIEARLINDKEVLIAAISDKDYYYVANELKNIKQTPHETKLFFEDEDYYGEYKTISPLANLDLNNSYTSFFNMHYSGTDAAFGASAQGDMIGNLSLNFGDPLSQNSISAFLIRDESRITIAGAEYSNAQYLLNYVIAAYRVVDDDNRNNVRDGGVMVGANLPLYKAGYYETVVGASYYQDYDEREREPISATLTFSRSEAYGVSMYANYLNFLELYGVSERSDKIYGVEYKFKHDLPSEFYVGFGAKYSKTDSDTYVGARGVKLSNVSYQQDMDPSTINMPSLDGSAYIKNAGYGEVNLAKVFNFSSYFFTFPLSLQRESLYAKYRYYDIKSFSNSKFDANEVTVGTTLSTVLLNSFVLPISFEYIYNDAIFIENKNSFRLILGATF